MSSDWPIQPEMQLHPAGVTAQTLALTLSADRSAVGDRVCKDLRGATAAGFPACGFSSRWICKQLERVKIAGVQLQPVSLPTGFPAVGFGSIRFL